MHFFTMLVLFLASRPISADSEKFDLLTIRSGSPLQYASVYSMRGCLYLGHGNVTLSAIVTDCGLLRFDNGKYAVISSRGLIKEGTKQEATGTFSIRHGHLTVFNSETFQAIPKGEKFLFSTKATSKSLSVVIRAQSIFKGYAVPNFISSNNCSVRSDFPFGLGTVSSNYSTVKNSSETVPVPQAVLENMVPPKVGLWGYSTGLSACLAATLVALTFL
ncbi:(ZYRO0G19734g) [Zygosaccharomyces parabailii]|uniref:ZYBA0S03-04412g1_1 n=1 Tax=Zygosaccharomyces bailii (strain CLIB 213 / ATCC 58445 / CBS 680 / BCRC 21525 / NBRC 1098 / NCYC 1416 / NRRL Y-2227) TaxID=1333698 RepID=A0A8J2T4N6_ZYGB2|nr:(ZYRO0G19734g) [Zygosaccharomyces parabailii]CDF88894.1 ZYBA0S03-04412g1_1 [Zygosaccharomyces bailii CLIB 213]